MRAVVTGGCGFIGSHLAEALARRGDSVLVIDSLVTGRATNLTAALESGAALEVLDITEGDRLAKVVSAFHPDVVFHLAAQIDVRKSLGAPAFDAAVNVVGTVNVLEAARAAGARRVVNTSTGGAMYGAARQLPTPESAAAQPESAYGISKRCAEYYCEWYTRFRGVSTISLRYSNVVGPRQNPLGEAGVVAIFCHLALTGGTPVVYGDGGQTRDFVYVSDVVQANLAAAVAPAVSGVLNVGTGVETSVLDLIEVIGAAAGLESSMFQPRFLPGRQGELARSCLDARELHRLLGVRAKVDLSAAVLSTLAATRRQASAD